VWQVKVLKRAEKALEKLDKQNRAKLIEYIDLLKDQAEPYKKGKALTGKFSGLWRFRVGDYRIITKIDMKVITIVVLDLGHRKEVYD
jgi:mRNA interferase RelE/StbE